MGGDDYITKPFKLNELFSRINALLRRAKLSDGAPNGITVKLLENRVWKNNRELQLTAAEYRLLCLLMRHPNIVLTREILLDRLWDGNGSYIDNNALSVYVRRLREKVEDDPDNPVFFRRYEDWVIGGMSLSEGIYPATAQKDGKSRR